MNQGPDRASAGGILLFEWESILLGFEMPKAISPMVAIQASAGITAAGRNGFSFATYLAKWAKSPHATPGCPGGPHNPKRSATAERNAEPRAIRA